VLLQAFTTEGETRHAAILELAHGPADSEVVEIFVHALPELMWDEQEQVASALVALRDPRGFDALLALTRHQHFFARRIAADALGCWGDPRAAPALMRLLNDENTKVRRHAGEALAAIGEPARAPLETALTGKVTDTFKANAQSTLYTFDVIGQAREGQPIDINVLSHSWPSAIPRVAAILRERQATDEYRHLAECLQHHKSGIRWFARLLLLEIGEAACGPVVPSLHSRPARRQKRRLSPCSRSLTGGRQRRKMRKEGACHGAS
jgi:HEAT repeat protein